MIKFTRPFLAMVSKAKAAKLVRNMIDMYLDLEAGTGEEVVIFIHSIRQKSTMNEFNRIKILDSTMY